jgi:alpha-mannosidase
MAWAHYLSPVRTRKSASFATQPNYLSMQKFHRNITLERLDKFTSTQYFQDVNLFSKLFKARSNETVSLSVWSAPALERTPFALAVKQQFKKTAVGESFGPSWSTHWFKVSITIPVIFSGETVVFCWDSDSEALIWSIDGKPLQGLTGGSGWDRRVEYLLIKQAKAGDTFNIFIEMACNGMFGVGNNGQINPPEPNRMFQLKTCEIAAIDQEASKLWFDFQIISGMARELPNESQRGCEALSVANAIINAFRPDDRR